MDSRLIITRLDRPGPQGSDTMYPKDEQRMSRGYARYAGKMGLGR